MGFWFAYFLGAFSFLPIVCGCIFAFAYFSFPEVFHDEFKELSIRSPSDDDKVFASLDVVTRLKRSGSKDKESQQQQQLPQDVAAGYFAVTREYVPGGINGKPPERPAPNGNSPNESPSVYQTMYRSLFERKQASTSSVSSNVKGKNVFFVVLRHGHLMLYDDEEQVEVRHVISLGHHTVSIYGGEGETIPEGELYIKRNALRLARKSSSKGAPTSKPFFLFSENCSDKEDFYFALVKNQEREEAKDGVSLSKPLHFETKHIISLVQRLHSTEEDLQTRWLNGLVGRVFLALYKTSEVEEHIRSKITKKIARVKRPAFLSNIVVQKIDCGEGAPFITNPKMRELTADGEFSAEADVKYSGNFRIEISTVATLSLGNRIKPRQVPLVLAVVFKKLEGHAILRMKPPPSNRLWLSFVEMPKMDIAVEPIVSSRQITWNMVLRPIENRIKEVIAETMVSPFWDDIPFIPTDDEPLRGGLWESMRAGNSTEEEDPVNKGSVEDAEKQDKLHEDADTPTNLLSDHEKSMSMPMLSEASEPKPINKPKRTPSLASSPPAINEDRAMTTSADTPTGGVTQRAKIKRSASIGTPASSAPVVATTTVYAAAERQEPMYDNDKSDAISSVMSITRSRSSSESQPQTGSSPFHTPYGSPTLNNSTISGISQTPSATTIESGSSIPADSKSLRSMKSWRSTGSGGTTASATTADSFKGKLGTIKNNFSGISFPSVKGFNMTNAPNNANPQSTESTNPVGPSSSPNPERNTLATIANAGVAVKKWYINSRKKDEDAPESGFHPHEFESSEYIGAGEGPKPYPKEGPPKMSEADLKERITGFGSTNLGTGESAYSTPGVEGNGSHGKSGKQFKYSLPPAEIPPPPAKRTEPINVPKRKSLPPPMLPPRQNNGRLAPPDMEEQQMMVIAAPMSEPTTPGDEVQLQGVYFGGSSPEEERKKSSSTATITTASSQPDYEGESYGPLSPSSNNSTRSGSGGSSERWEPRQRPTGRRTTSDPDDTPSTWTSEEEWRWRNRLVSEITGEEG